jgi:hypothetical protein
MLCGAPFQDLSGDLIGSVLFQHTARLYELIDGIDRFKDNLSTLVRWVEQKHGKLSENATALPIEVPLGNSHLAGDVLGAVAIDFAALDNAALAGRKLTECSVNQ